MPEPLNANSDTPITPHDVGAQSAGEAIPGTILGGMISGLLYYITSLTSHPMDAGTAASIAGGLVALGAIVSSYIKGRGRA